MKIFKNNIKIIIAFIIGGIVFSGATAIALSVVASDVAYDNTQSGSEATTMQGAIDDLYDKAANMGGDLHVVKLGTGTSYNIKNSYPNIDYTSLTISNFYYTTAGASSLEDYSSQDDQVRVTYTAPSFSYNKSTGVLTCGNAQAKLTSTSSYYGTTHNFPVTVTTTCYMVYVD